jgi:osmotically-inducible protein OsmY
MKSDTQIQNDIENELVWTPEVDAADIFVKVSGGVVTLTGHVPSYHDKLQAESAAKRVLGCAGVANDIEVRRASAHTKTDPQIAREAVDAISADLPEVANDVQVVVRDGHVTLEGAVEWHWQRQRLESTVRSVKGIDVVNNLIAIRPRPVPADIKHRIEDAFRRSAEIDAGRVSVETHDNVVILRGQVRSHHERDEAQRTAWSAPGVTRVANNITISP